MDSINKQLLTIIQDGFPVTTRPYKKIGEQLGISEDETIGRLTELKEQGIIRRLGGIFDSRKLGYTSTLCAMEVPTEKINDVAQVVNSYVGVTHNYIRKHDYNMWFTLISPSDTHLEKTLNEIERLTGYVVMRLPANRLFKIKVQFKIPG